MPRTIARRAPLLAVLLLTPIACDGDVPPQDLEATIHVTHAFDDVDSMVVTALVSGEVLPSREELTISVDGADVQHLVSVGAHVFAAHDLRPPAPGEPIDVVLTTPAGSAELAVPMVHPTAAAAVPAIGLAPGASLDLAWAASFPEERDWIGFRGQGYVSWQLPPEVAPEGVLEVPPGATSITIPPELVATWRRGVETFVAGAISQPVLGTVVVLRTRAADAAPALAGGQIVVAFEVVNQAVTLLP